MPRRRVRKQNPVMVRLNKEYTDHSFDQLHALNDYDDSGMKVAGDLARMDLDAKRDRRRAIV